MMTSYWNWSKNSDLYTNPVFDTTQTPENSLSLSGDGAYAAPNPTDPDPDPGLDFAPGRGGGCVLDGPFKDWPVRMGPFSAAQAYAYAPVPENAFAHNPRCLQRNLDVARIQYYNNPSVVESLLSAPSIAVFQDILDRTIPGTWQLAIGAHGGGHISVGPTLADVFASPQDPVFMLHHGFIDLLWDAWQRSGSDSGEGTDRMRALNGTTMYTNPPGAEEATLDTVMEFGVLGSPKKIGEVMDVRGGEYCYRYE
jgi:tyrosinase